ncbi:MAG: heat-inducible transcription repressor HrcA [Candidatus Marinimicrobia bacterium]|jgi:heat-inducible transcriptional repressor|nr:heat-inducible transcription repressor HrcA [Candidatus Neomarinimicrobiota bacterium]MBT6758747.1 heat-inducible transcription repressor HrcA [Candidatus Neomarinimicrobiota bacterium]
MNRMSRQALQNLKDREEKVLKWLVRDYAINGNPVGSSRLVAMDYFKVGSASLRHVLSDLELGGYLLQPHTSAGRIPTDKGYRYFVDRLMELEQPEQNVTRTYETGLDSLSRDLDRLIKNTAQFLGDMSHALVLMSRPQERATRIRSIALHELDKDSILLIVHMSLEQVKTVAFELESQLSRIMLQEAENILNDLFAGRDIDDVQKQVEQRNDEVVRKNPIIDQILKSFNSVLDSNSTSDYQTYGTHQLLHYPEMADPNKLEFILEAIETDTLQGYLPTPLFNGKPSVFIGGELGQTFFKNMSLISIAYNGNNCSGEIHILGPTRMEYERIIGLAEFTADKIETLINTKYTK